MSSGTTSADQLHYPGDALAELQGREGVGRVHQVQVMVDSVYVRCETAFLVYTLVEKRRVPLHNSYNCMLLYIDQRLSGGSQENATHQHRPNLRFSNLF